MWRKKKKCFVVSIVFVLGLAMSMPTYSLADEVTAESTAQIGQVLKGTVVDHYGEEIIVKTEEGTRYHVGLYLFNSEIIESMNISPGDIVEVEGETLESFDDLYDFNYFKRSLPDGVTEEEMKKLEALYNEVKVMEKSESWEEAEVLWQSIYGIINQYYESDWEPEPFEDYIRMFEYDFTSEDLIRLEELYNQWSVNIDYNDEASYEMMDQFYEIISSYYVPPTFDEYIADMGLTITEADYAILKQSYDAFQQSFEDEDESIAIEKMEAFDKLIYPYYRSSYQLPTFEEYMADYDFDIVEDDMKKLQEVYGNILDVEKNGNYEDEDGLWQSFYELLDSYYEVEESTPFRAFKVIVNGETF